MNTIRHNPPEMLKAQQFILRAKAIKAARSPATDNAGEAGGVLGSPGKKALSKPQFPASTLTR
jgi:hypothetical protein